MKVAIMKRDASDDEAMGNSGFTMPIDTAATRAKLERLYEDRRRSYPQFPDAYHLGNAWRDLDDDERSRILEQDLEGQGDVAGAALRQSTMLGKTVGHEKQVGILLKAISGVVADAELTKAEREEVLRDVCTDYNERAGRDALADIAKIRAASDIDVAPMAKDVDIGGLALFALQSQAEMLRKADPTLTREKAYAAACDAKPWLLKVQRDARRRQLVLGAGEATRNAAIAKRNEAFATLQKHAEELRKSNPRLSPERARVEARQRWPEIASRERAAAMEARSP